MASEASSPDQTKSRTRRLLSRLPRPGLTAVAVLGATTWLFALWIGPWLAPGPAPADAEREAAATGAMAPAPVSKPGRSALALPVPEGPAEDEPNFLTRVISVRPGDTLMEVLTRAKVAAQDAHAAIAALRDVFNPRSLVAGTKISLTFEPGHEAGADPSLTGLEFSPSIVETVGVARTDDDRFESFSSKAKLTREPSRASGTITSSLYVDAVEAGVPPQVVVELIRSMSFDVDFQRDLQPRDRFDLLYERILDADGRVVGSGSVMFASLTLSGKQVPIYRFRMDDGTYDYFNPKGESTRKALMRTPIDGARLSSRFGRRHHPILGYTTMHRGIDFAAPSGTPIMAAGHGVVVEAGWKGAYGRYIRVRHNATYSTAYAHLSRLGKGIRRGARVSQGQVIGYVGTTGRSTGPHLHYEVLSNNRQVNPLSVKLPTGRTLHGAERERFLATRAKTDTLFASLPSVTPDTMARARATNEEKPAAGKAPTEPLGIGGP